MNFSGNPKSWGLPVVVEPGKDRTSVKRVWKTARRAEGRAFVPIPSRPRPEGAKGYIAGAALDSGSQGRNPD